MQSEHNPHDHYPVPKLTTVAPLPLRKPHKQRRATLSDHSCQWPRADRIQGCNKDHEAFHRATAALDKVYPEEGDPTTYLVL